MQEVFRLLSFLERGERREEVRARNKCQQSKNEFQVEVMVNLSWYLLHQAFSCTGPG